MWKISLKQFEIIATKFLKIKFFVVLEILIESSKAINCAMQQTKSYRKHVITDEITVNSGAPCEECKYKYGKEFVLRWYSKPESLMKKLTRKIRLLI